MGHDFLAYLAGNGRGPWQEPQRGRRPCPARPAGAHGKRRRGVAFLADIRDIGKERTLLRRFPRALKACVLVGQ